MTAGSLSIPVAMLAGLLSFLAPCVLPLFPSYLSFVAGVSYDELPGPATSARARRAVFRNALLFIAGFSAVFVALGVPVSLLGQALAQYQGAIARVGGIFIIGMGLAVPFFLGALALRRFLALFERYKRFLSVVSVASGLLLVAVGLLLVTDQFTRLSAIALRFTPAWLYRYL